MVPDLMKLRIMDHKKQGVAEEAESGIIVLVEGHKGLARKAVLQLVAFV
jgi:hypothetical protein